MDILALLTEANSLINKSYVEWFLRVEAIQQELKQHGLRLVYFTEYQSYGVVPLTKELILTI